MKNYFVIRNGCYTRSTIHGIYYHNERKKDSYRNEDIVASRSHLNIHYKKATGTYISILEQMVSDSIVSLRGLRKSAILFDEFVLDVNSKYFEANGGYESAKQFYDIAYCFCCQEVGEDNIISAVMHADERNRALSEEIDHDVWHYHMHVIYLPVVKKEVRYTKRCKNPELVGKVKEVVNQVSHSKRWTSTPVLGEDGMPIRDEKGNVILEPSYGELQTRFADYMQAHGYQDIDRGIAGKKAKHKSIVEYKLAQDEARAEAAANKADRLEQHSLQLAENIVTQQETLTNLHDMDEYVEEVESCRSLLQQIFDELSSFLSRSTIFRDRRAEHDFFERLREGLVDFFARLRNLLGFELVVGMAPEHCQSPQLAEEGERLALDLQIGEAQQRADTTLNTLYRKEFDEHDRS